MQDPQPDFRPKIGEAEEVAPGIRRLVAPNPSPMTFRGTNTYLVGEREVAVIDPGPEDASHLQAILDACAGATVAAILVTHAHVDHSPLAARLKAATGAPIYAFSDATGGRSAVMQHLAATGLVGGGEGVDAGFAPDICLRTGDNVEIEGASLTALHTPGHFGNHLAFALGDHLFCGDLVMGWASSLVSPPDGDLTDFMASCRMLRETRWSSFHAGHGAPIDDPAARLDWLISHRLSREAAILDALQDSPATCATLAERIYTDTPAILLPAAMRNVLAHIIDLYGKKRVFPKGELTADAVFELV
ncbi:MBL fold metallo-hydrolase [Marivita hallyeonensis]|uniref:Glyoxylase, beta-lactamase superfamily II n=1 Tax=Marivita hallyeonensis TaxID=996342 RepID=A0A1M5QWK3_9RHOB|nr:MBL fold metallo-hydrolase [Marivita hallyeonensis]SHH18089.1 Glyoxylase, beta-lactamase superfamily II [Marivita hallyeonensis]